MSSQRSNWRERLAVNLSRMDLELAAKLESSGIQYQTQVEVPITTADFYFAIDPRPTLVFVDGKPHLNNCSHDRGRRVTVPSQEERIQSSRARCNDVFGHNPVRQLVSHAIADAFFWVLFGTGSGRWEG